MQEEISEPTRVMQAPADADRTQVAAAPAPIGATQAISPVICPVCHTSNPALEVYCVECGFLLASTPGTEEQPPEAAAGLELLEASGGRRFRLRPGVNMVGRESGEVLLMDSTVSRRHAQITLSDNEVTVTDLNSTNGTFVDGKRVAPGEAAPVPIGSTLRFGNVSLTLVEPGAEAPVPSEVTRAFGPQAEATQVFTAGSGAAPGPAQPGITVSRTAQGLAEGGELRPLARLHPADGNGEPVDLYPGPATIGRRTSNDVVIAGDPFVSGRHAEIVCDDTGCYVTDLNSTNGTVLNGVKLEPGQRVRMEDGDELTIGRRTYRLEIVKAGPDAAPEAMEEGPEDASVAEAGEAEGEHSE